LHGHVLHDFRGLLGLHDLHVLPSSERAQWHHHDYLDHGLDRDPVPETRRDHGRPVWQVQQPRVQRQDRP
jgi:hypothetical protein